MSVEVGTRPHPAKFSPNVITVMRQILTFNQVKGNVLDPFGGVGGIHQLAAPDLVTWCVELEPEWAAQSCQLGFTWCGDFFNFEPPVIFMGATGREIITESPAQFDVICTSPTYGNRMADHHNARDDSTRITYKHKLGRDLTPGNSGVMPYGNEYKAFHIRAYNRFRRLLVPGGLVILNVSDFIRDGKVVQASKWHHCRMLQFGYRHLRTYQVPTQRMGMGANRELRVEAEQVHVYMA